MPNDPSFVTGLMRPETVAAALPGLLSERKTLPPWLFYDEEGCRLFYEITRLPEYYLTRTETALLSSLGADLVPPGFRNGALVEFGGSDETKARYLLDLPGGLFGTYITIDVAGAALEAMRTRLRASHPRLRVIPVVGDFMKQVALPEFSGPAMGFFPGSTIGNLDPVQAEAFLRGAHGALGHGAWFLLGADLRKSPDRLLPAYNDAAGVTAAFNLNLLRRLNHEAGASFDLEDFRHEALWNDAESRIEMHLIARRDHTVRVAGRPVRFRRNETIHTENSYKHEAGAILAIARAAGWELERRWTDPEGLFGLFLFHGSPR